MGKFLCLRHAKLGLAGVGDDLAQDVVQVLGGEQHAKERRQRVGIAGHPHRRGELEDALAGEAVERRIEQRGENFAHAVRAEVKAQDGVAVLHSSVVVDHRGRYELIEFPGGVGGLDRCPWRSGSGALGFDHRAIRQGDTIPTLVAVHGEIAADDGGDRNAVR